MREKRGNTANYQVNIIIDVKSHKLTKGGGNKKKMDKEYDSQSWAVFKYIVFKYCI